jgi:hypothetical protein
MPFAQTLVNLEMSIRPSQARSSIDARFYRHLWMLYPLIRPSYEQNDTNRSINRRMFKLQDMGDIPHDRIGCNAEPDIQRPSALARSATS